MYATEAIFTIDDRQLTSVSNTNGYDTENARTENAVTFVAGSVARAASELLCVDASWCRRRYSVQVGERESRVAARIRFYGSVCSFAAAEE